MRISLAFASFFGVESRLLSDSTQVYSGVWFDLDIWKSRSVELTSHLFFGFVFEYLVFAQVVVVDEDSHKLILRVTVVCLGCNPVSDDGALVVDLGSAVFLFDLTSVFGLLSGHGLDLIPSNND